MTKCHYYKPNRFAWVEPVAWFLLLWLGHAVIIGGALLAAIALGLFK